jgi:uncharacterized protein YndB with AHSA1/START domain
MRIRKPVDVVFNAFVDPVVTTQFWFTRSTGRLEPSAEVHWFWDMYGVSTRVVVKELEANRRILIEWDDPPCPVEWRFTARPDGTTMVTIENRGFHGDEAEVMSQALDAKGGFTFVLAGLKAFLEHGIRLELVADLDPDAHVPAWSPEGAGSV